MNLSGGVALTLIVVNCVLFLKLLSKHYNETSYSSTGPQLVRRKDDQREIYFTDNIVKCSGNNEKVTQWSLLYTDQNGGSDYGCKAVELLNWALALKTKEKRIFSQNGEDGVLLEIFEKIGTKFKHFVEFGVEDGSQCNTRIFREQHGWKGVMFDYGHNNPAIGLHKASMWVENVIEKFQSVQVPLEFDLLSVDTDFGDFWLLREILQAGYSPRVIVAEVNVAPGPFASFTVPLERAKAHEMWHGTRWFGSSILAVSKLMHAYGYQLLYVDRRVVNAIFIKSSEINNTDLARVAWQRQIFDGLDYGIAHPPDAANRPYVHICQQLPCSSSNDW